MAADLHCHTKLSDGSVGIEELIKLARVSGVGTIAITDHDTFAGAIRGKVIGDRQGIDVIPGAEISCWDSQRGRNVHLLCYLCDRPERLEVIFRETSEQRKITNNKIAQEIHSVYPFCSELLARHVAGSTNLFKQHILHALVDAGYTATIYGEVYDELFSKEGEIAKLRPEYPDVFEALELVRSAGGISVLAHPMLYGNLNLLPELIGKGLDGVEVWHPTMTEDDSNYLARVAQDSGLIMTGGTDFHGMYSREPIRVGQVTAPDEQVKRMYQLKSGAKRRG